MACEGTCDACPYHANAPETDDGKAAWEVLRRCSGQVRAVMGGVYAIDFSAVLMLADAMGALNPILVETLPELEPIVVRAYRRETSP